MTTSNHNCCRWRRTPDLTALAFALSALVACAAAAEARGAQAGADRAPPAPPAPAAAAGEAAVPEELYLAVELNTVETGQLARFVVIDGRFHASAATLRDLGLSWPDAGATGGLVALDSLPGLESGYDPLLQRLSITVPVDLLGGGTVRLGYRAPPAPRQDPASTIPGLILNYDLYGQHGDGQSNLSAWNELRLFGVGSGVFVHSATVRAFRAPGAGTRHEARRLDTFWEYDDPERMLTLTVGDTLTGALAWTRQTRIGGIRLARNFALQPYRVTTPLASFAGEAVLPSTVDILINGIRQSSQEVPPGQFVIDSAPMLSGAGQAQMVITDINGRSRMLDFALYGTPQLLEAGLSDWSLELGAVRRGYGQASSEYAGDPVFSATGRRGFSDRTTLEGHAQLADDLQLAGLGGAWRLGGRGGLLTAAAAGSRRGGDNGSLASLGYQWSSARFNLFASSTRRSEAFRDVGSLETGWLPRRTDQAFLGFNTGLGQFGASYILQADHENDASRFASLTWSRQLPRNGVLSLNLSRSLDDDDSDSAYLFWSMPLDRRTAVSATARHGSRAHGVSVGANRSPSADLGGWGWRAQATAGDQPGAQAELGRLGQHGQWTVGASHWRGRNGAAPGTTGYASANGGLVLVRGKAYAMRRVDDAFAVVDTNGFAGVPVRLENRIVGQTDHNGLLLVSRLNAWQNNQLSIDPLDLPVDTRLGATSIDAVPRGRSGLLAAFEVQRIVAVEMRLLDASGRPLPAGSPVWLDRSAALEGASPRTVVGHDGMTWLADPAPDATLYVAAGDILCAAGLALEAGAAGTIDLGEVTCR